MNPHTWTCSSFLSRRALGSLQCSMLVLLRPPSHLLAAKRQTIHGHNSTRPKETLEPKRQFLGGDGLVPIVPLYLFRPGRRPVLTTSLSRGTRWVYSLIIGRFCFGVMNHSSQFMSFVMSQVRKLSQAELTPKSRLSIPVARGFPKRQRRRSAQEPLAKALKIPLDRSGGGLGCERSRWVHPE